MKRLQIKDAGAWRNVVSFTTTEEVLVLQAASDLLRALQETKTVMRVVDGEMTLLTCAAPDCLWTPARRGSQTSPGATI